MPYKNKIMCVYGIFNTEHKCIYVGSTNNFYNRKRQHKACCVNKNNRGFNIPLYKFIRDNGGFNNFTFEILIKVECIETLRSAEREVMKKYNPPLNVYDVDIDCRHNKVWKSQNTLKSRKKHYDNYAKNLKIYKNKKYINPFTNKIQTLNAIQQYFFRRHLKVSVRNLTPVDE